jgi:hypothetical protein
MCRFHWSRDGRLDDQIADFVVEQSRYAGIRGFSEALPSFELSQQLLDVAEPVHPGSNRSTRFALS